MKWRIAIMRANELKEIRINGGIIVITEDLELNEIRVLYTPPGEPSECVLSIPADAHIDPHV